MSNYFQYGNDSEASVKRTVEILAGGQCQCELESHHHPNGRCPKLFIDDQSAPHFLKRNPTLAINSSNVIALCTNCKNRVLSSRKKIR